ncbi:large ribosomal subunit protein mL39-like [Watersipora subatra]|uniref:large ribosomal subunit protein mL39-like n=1 Tax=Watersipora subatra TaxID=2589382 RepID=UPI00355BB787
MNRRICRLLCKGHISQARSLLPTCRHAHNRSLEEYELEREQQSALHKRVQKISVNFVGVPGAEDIRLDMNKYTSTPYACAKHISEYHQKHSCLSLVNGVPWDMHRPIIEDCAIQFLNFQQDDPSIINQAYWRACAFILGSVLERALKPECNVRLHRPPDFSVESGSFAYDFSAEFGREDWRPTSRELLLLSQMALKLSHGIKGKANFYTILPLDVPLDVAKRMFSHNSKKLDQLEELRQLDDKTDVTVYKMGNHVDMLNTGGPLISNADVIGRFNVAAIHKIGEDGVRSTYRAQGVSLPAALTMHPWTYDHLIKNATLLNTSEELPREETKERVKEVEALSG